MCIYINTNLPVHPIFFPLGIHELNIHIKYCFSNILILLGNKL